ncbi:MAG: serine/threonine-protein kinase [Planctomycetota bacterium]
MQSGAPPPNPSGERAGDVIDRYTLVAPLGEGGMGTVWRATQQVPVKREVALKIVKLGMDTREVVQRFEAERQALALMDHPGIAKVLDGGATNTGRPYFVMELVQGAPITKFCDEQRLGLRERLELFAEVCDAVQHAHHKGVIHRDLKPSNVLVAMGEHGPAPKVIDFGIAKATSAQLTEATMQTELGQIVGTPEYMAPEQSLGDGTDVDTRADVYSLGVMLYELLTGTKTFDVKRALATGFDELLRQIREVDPALPSTRVSSLGDTATTVASSRGSDATTLSKRLKGDLDWVVMRAIEKDRERRYDTPAALAEDVQRFLANEPVEAAPPSAAYRLRKFAVRRKKTVAAVATIGLLLVGGLAGTGYGLVEARRANDELEVANDNLEVAVDEKQDALERETEQRELAEANETRAQRELTRARTVTGIVHEMLTSASYHVALGRDTTILREITDEIAQKLVAGEVDDPLVAAEVDSIVALTYLGIDDVESARRHYERAYAGYAQEVGERDRRTLDCRASLLMCAGRQGECERALEEGEALLDVVRATLESDSSVEATVLSTMGTAAYTLARHDAAERYLTEALATTRRLEERMRADEAIDSGSSLADGRASLDRVIALRDTIRHNQALLLADLSRFDESLALFDTLLAEGLALASPDDPQVLGTRSARLSTLSMAGRTQDALVESSALIDSLTRVVGPDSPRVVDAKLEHTKFLGDLGRNDEALELGLEVVQEYTGRLGISHPETSFARYLVAMTLYRRGDVTGASALFDELLPIVREHGAGSKVGQSLKVINSAGLVKTAAGELDEAEALTIEAIEGSTEIWGPESRDTLGSITNLGWLYLRMGRPQEALEQFEKSLPIERRVLGETHHFTRSALTGVMNAKFSTGDVLGGRVASLELRDALVARVEEEPQDLIALNELVKSYLVHPMADLRDPAAAVPYAERAVAVSQRQNTDALGWLATSYGMSGRHREAYDTATELLGKLEEGTPHFEQVSRARAHFETQMQLEEEREAEADGAEDGEADDGD